jgi:hypothetical protein
MRGFQSWLTSFKPWRDLEIGVAPNQLFVWAIQNSSQGTFFAAPLADARTRVAKITDFILQKGSQFFATNSIARFRRSQTSGGLEWKGVPYVDPFLKSVSTNDGEFVLGGVFEPAATGLSPVPAELLQQIYAVPNLVFYDWEMTGERSDHWIYMGQFVRYAAYIPQMEPELAGQHWLKTASLTLRNCITALTLGTNNQISFSRKSTVGFTAIELHLLADWLDTPDFPRGLHSLSPPGPTVDPAAPETNKPQK